MKTFLAALLLPIFAAAQTGFNGAFTNTTNGVKAIMSIANEYGVLSGTYYEAGYDLAVVGTVNGKRMTGELKDMSTGSSVALFIGDMYNDSTINVVLTVDGKERQGLFQREDASTLMPKPTGSVRGNDAKPVLDGKARDVNIIGTWRYENVITSGGTSLATALLFVLDANGGYKQYSKAAGGSSDWSYESGDTELVSQGMWYTEDNVLYLKQTGESDYTAAATYKLVDEKLVTEDVNGKKIWNRQ